MTSYEKLTEIKNVAKECREAQKLYFMYRTHENLIKSKQLEQKLDKLIFEHDSFQLILDI